MKTLKINVPEGFEIDKDKSTFEEIVFKPIVEKLPKKWEDLKSVKGWWVTEQANLNTASSNAEKGNENVFVTKEQAKAAIALAQLSQLREVYRQGWVPDWNYAGEMKHAIVKLDGKIDSTMLWRSAHFLSFQSESIVNEFLRNFKDLIEEASPLLFG